MAATVENGRAVTPPSQDVAERLLFGPLTTAQAVQVLEQQLAAVWAAVLESHGYDWRSGWALKFDDLRLERVLSPHAPGQPGQQPE